MSYLIDLTALAGVVTIVAGVAMIHVPSSLIVGGLLAVAVAVAAAARGKSE